MNRILSRSIIFLLLFSVSITAAWANRINLRDPIRLANNEVLSAVYYFPHWWDPWKSDDSAITEDFRRMKEMGLNTVCLDHEVSQAIDREWYWLDREYRLANEEDMKILPWLQLQAVDREALMQFSQTELQMAFNQDGEPEPDCVVYRDPEFRKALAHYITVYLDRYIENPALLTINHRRQQRPVVGLMVEVGWRNARGQPLSFDDETNDYFRRWMRSSHFDLAQLNEKWGTNYSSFDEIDPKDKTIFDYDFYDSENMPGAVQDHVAFRARLIHDALRDVAREVRRKHRDVLFVAEVAYPFSSPDPNAVSYRWNSPNEYRAVQFADIIFIRTLGNTSCQQMKKEQELMIMNGKQVVLAYRMFDNSTPAAAVALALDCARTANGLAYYNWNETADDLSAIYDKPEMQELVKLMAQSYKMLYNIDKRHDIIPPPPWSPEYVPPVQPEPVEIPEAEAEIPEAEEDIVEEETESVPAEVIEEEIESAPADVETAEDDEVDEEEEDDSEQAQIPPAPVEIPQTVTSEE